MHTNMLRLLTATTMRHLRRSASIPTVATITTTPSTASHNLLWPANVLLAPRAAPTGCRGISAACLPPVSSPAIATTAGANALVRASGLRVALGEVGAARVEVGACAVPTQSAQRIGLRGFASSAKEASTSVAAAEPEATGGWLRPSAGPLHSSAFPKLNPPRGDAGLVAKFKVLWKKYGWVFVGTYAAVWLTTLSTFYVLVDQGFMQTKGFDEHAVPNPLNPLEMLKKGKAWLGSKGLDPGLPELDAGASTFLIAYLATKITEPGRFIIAAMLTPRVARVVRGR